MLVGRLEDYWIIQVSQICQFQLVSQWLVGDHSTKEKQKYYWSANQFI